MVTPNPEKRVPESIVSHARETSDRSLLRRLQGGQSDASTELYLRYAQRLHALAAVTRWP
jgi:hypothetical protein